MQFNNEVRITFDLQSKNTLQKAWLESKRKEDFQNKSSPILCSDIKLIQLSINLLV